MRRRLSESCSANRLIGARKNLDLIVLFILRNTKKIDHIRYIFICIYIYIHLYLIHTAPVLLLAPLYYTEANPMYVEA